MQEYTCPTCGAVTVGSTRAWKVECSNEECGKVFRVVPPTGTVEDTRKEGR